LANLLCSMKLCKAYPGPRNSVLDSFFSLVRAEKPDEAVAGLLSSNVTTGVLLAATIGTYRLRPDETLERALQGYTSALISSGGFGQLHPAIQLIASGSYKPQRHASGLLKDSTLSLDPSYDVAAVRALLAWGDVFEAEERLTRIDVEEAGTEGRVLCCRVKIKKRDFLGALAEVEGLHPADPDATVAAATCADMVDDRALRSKMLEELRSVPSTFEKRFECQFRLNNRLGRYLSNVGVLWEFYKSLKAWQKPIRRLNAELKTRTEQLR
jgi:hypothetical protein